MHLPRQLVQLGGSERTLKAHAKEAGTERVKQLDSERERERERERDHSPIRPRPSDKQGERAEAKNV